MKRALPLVAVLIGIVVVACGGSAEPDGDSPISRHAVVGEDDRVRITDTTAFPWRAIAYLELYYDAEGDVGQCTGTFIGPDAVLTAAHCLWNSERGWVDRVRVVPGKNGRDEPFGSEWASGFWVPDAWVDEDEPPLRDWGVVSLPDDRLGQSTGWLTLAVLGDETLATDDLEPAIVGYHGDVSPHGSLWGHFADAFVAVQDSNLLYEIDATPGSSGSAILLTNSQGDRWVVGIHAYGIDLGESEGYNLGSRVTGAVLTDVRLGCQALGCSISWEFEANTSLRRDPPTSTATTAPPAVAEPPSDPAEEPGEPTRAQLQAFYDKVQAIHQRRADRAEGLSAKHGEDAGGRGDPRWVDATENDRQAARELWGLAGDPALANAAMSRWWRANIGWRERLADLWEAIYLYDVASPQERAGFEASSGAHTALIAAHCPVLRALGEAEEAEECEELLQEALRD